MAQFLRVLMYQLSWQPIYARIGSAFHGMLLECLPDCIFKKLHRNKLDVSSEGPYYCARSNRAQGFGRVDDNGRRWLLSDCMGRLTLLVLVEAVDGSVASLRREDLGTTTPAQTLSYIDGGYV